MLPWFLFLYLVPAGNSLPGMDMLDTLQRTVVEIEWKNAAGCNAKQIQRYRRSSLLESTRLFTLTKFSIY
jgi:hypothetical protein